MGAGWGFAGCGGKYVIVRETAADILMKIMINRNRGQRGIMCFYFVQVSLMIMLFSIILAASRLCMALMVDIYLFLAEVLALACPSIFHKLIKTTREEKWKENDDFYSTCLDGPQGSVTLKAYNAYERHRRKAEIQSEEMRKKTTANLVRTTLNSRVMGIKILAEEVT